MLSTILVCSHVLEPTDSVQNTSVEDDDEAIEEDSEGANTYLGVCPWGIAGLKRQCVKNLKLVLTFHNVLALRINVPLESLVSQDQRVLRDH